MERRNFLQSSSVLLPFIGINPSILTNISETSEDPIKPFLLSNQPALENKGTMDIRVWVRSGFTNGLFSSVECAVAPKIMGPAPHGHLELDELMYVLEGTASVLLGDEVVEIQAGGWHMRPRMIKHTFFNASEKPLRFIDMYFNQPFEEYLEAVFHQLTPENGYPSGSPKKSEEIKRLSEKFGLIRYDDAQDQKQQLIKEYGLKNG
jgi:mannose-6-phosphate isomerase-like protein (cupin superfamily)